MIQLRRLFALLLITLCVGLICNAQSYTRSGNTYILSTGERNKTNDTIETTFKVKDTDGKEYAIYCSKSSGACFIKKISCNNKEYKKYLGKRLSRKVCAELNIEYKPRTRK